MKKSLTNGPGRNGQLRSIFSEACAHSRHATGKGRNSEENTRLSRRAFQDAYPQFPAFQVWIEDPELALLWHRRRRRRPCIMPGKEPRRDTVPRPKYDIRDYHPREVDGWILYATAQQRARGETAFVDSGQRIDINDSKSEASILAALQLSAEKWGRFVARGDRGFKDTCARLAAEHGFDLRNPELQTSIGKVPKKDLRASSEGTGSREGVALGEGSSAKEGQGRLRSLVRR